MTFAKDHIYIQMNDHVRTHSNNVHLKDIACIVCTSEKLKELLEKMFLFSFETEKAKKKVISIMYVYQRIHEVTQDFAEVHTLGSKDCLVELCAERKENTIIKLIKVGTVSLITFFGAAFSIMTYDQDAGVPDVFETLYRLFEISESQTGILESAYAIGIGLGVIIFFHHFEKQEERTPTAMEIQMHQYEKDIVEAYVEGMKRQRKSLEVDDG